MRRATPARVVELIDAMRAQGYSPRSYSGRGMFGASCVGVTLSREQHAVDLVLDVVDNLVGDASRSDEVEEALELVELLKRPSEDSMGLGTIVYWPRLMWPQVLLETEDDDDALDDVEHPLSASDDDSDRRNEIGG